MNSHNSTKTLLGVAALLGGTLFLGYFLAVWAAFGATLLAILFVGSLFFFLSPKWWWVPIPASFAAGGVLYFGFKLYLHELTLLLCALPLFFAVSLRFRAFYQYRRLLPWTFYLLGAYLIAHMAWSVGIAKFSGEGGYGNIFRHYSWALWPLAFGVLFVWFGSTRYLGAALLLLLGAYALRVSVTLITDKIGGFFYIPYINYVLPGSTTGETDDLRNSGLGLAALTVAYACISKKWWSRAFYIGGVTIAFGALLLGGGRTAVAMGLLLPLAGAMALKRYSLITISAAASVLFIAVLNLNPGMLDHVDPRIQRTLSILVLEEGAVQAHADTAMSNVWHERLRETAIDRWTSSTWSFFFGNNVKKFDAELLYIHGQSEWMFERALDRAVDVGAYETGWFATLANTGLCGLVFYMALMIELLRRPLAYIIANGVPDYVGAFSFLGVYYTAMWFIFGWTYGAYPSFEIMLLVVANVACYDYARQKASVKAGQAAVVASQQQDDVLMAPQAARV